MFGLPDVSERDRDKVQAANNMFVAAIKAIRRCLKSGQKGYLENPATSWVWQTPQMQMLSKHLAVHMVRVDMCQYACNWKKPTLLMIWNTPSVSLSTCSGKLFCSRTGRQHVSLTGFHGKRFATEQAQVYSNTFSAALMRTFCDELDFKPRPAHDHEP